MGIARKSIARERGTTWRAFRIAAFEMFKGPAHDQLAFSRDGRPRWLRELLFGSIPS